MMIRTLALSLGVALGGCVVHTTEPASTSTTTTTRAPYDPHFRVSDSIYESCGIANQTNYDVAEGTAACLKTGALNDKRVRVMGSRVEVDNARSRLVGQGVDISRIVTVYSDGPAYIDVVDNTLGKPEHLRHY